MERKNLFPVNKIPYLKNSTYRENNCIFCKVLENSPEVDNLLIHKGELVSISLNLYPYNPGHLMIFPHRHIEDLREIAPEEETELSYLTKLSLNLLEKVYQATGFNLGYNMGPFSGASINHLHLHIVPRYPNEVGFLDILSGTKLIVEEPQLTQSRLKAEIAKMI